MNCYNRLGKVLAFGLVGSFGLSVFADGDHPREQPVLLPATGVGELGPTFLYSKMNDLEFKIRNMLGGEYFTDYLAPFMTFDYALRSYNNAVVLFREVYHDIEWKKRVLASTEEGYEEKLEMMTNEPLFDTVYYSQEIGSLCTQLMHTLANISTLPPSMSYPELLNRCYEFIYHLNPDEFENFFHVDKLVEYADEGRIVDFEDSIFPEELVSLREACKIEVETLKNKAKAVLDLWPGYDAMVRLKSAVIAEEAGDGKFIYKLAPGLEPITDRLNNFERTQQTILRLLTHIYKFS
ncbi:MAG: hypothetical protein LBF72_02600 [Holosporales bacterium]|jgi:hypothetical protein|nr:hypothetical protein [Holosporales bacterium]